MSPALAVGLSPRVRGNLKQRRDLTKDADHGLSPRVRGNRLQIELHIRPLRPGLSPRVRGNHSLRQYVPDMAIVGSIPAACGGTQTRKLRSLCHLLTGSIPARAGEP